MGRFISKTTRLQLRRLLRRRRHATEDTVLQAAESIDKNFIARFGRVLKVKRFVFAWIGLAVLLSIATVLQTVALSDVYQSKRPVAGGTYHEGIVGTFSTANPLYASGAVDSAVSKLIFASLFKYNDNNAIEGDLASSYTVDETGKIYTVALRPHLEWQDGLPLTADDVVFTFKTIQNPDARSVLQSSMRSVTIEKVDGLHIRFTLASALSSFPASLTVGIVPQHILGKIEPSELRGNQFNTTTPIGAGPFKWQQLQLSGNAHGEGTAATITLDQFDQYYDGVPKLNRFIIHTYETEAELVNAFKHREITGMTGLNSYPKEFEGNDDVIIHPFQTTAEIMTFFNTQSTGPLSDVAVRRALLYATGRCTIIKQLDQDLKIVREAILPEQFAYDKTYEQPLFSKAKAIETLDQNGWVVGKNGIRAKNGKPLKINLMAEDNQDNRIITSEMKKQWKEVGADLAVTLQPSMDFQITLQTKGYDAVLHGISIGSDPDVYAYWHSSQATDGGMNLSNYKSSAADKALEAGRTRQTEAARSLRYKPFLKTWLDDVPAIAMFRSRIYYVTRGTVYGLTDHTLNTDTDRYNTVEHWQIRTTYVNDR